MLTKTFEIVITENRQTVTAKIKQCPDCERPVGPIEEHYADVAEVMSKLMIYFANHRAHL